MRKHSALKEIDLKRIGIRMRAMIGVQYDHVSQFAQQLGLSRNSVYNILRGRVTPDAQTLVDICDLLGCSMDFLLGVSSPEQDAEEGFETALLNIQEFRASWSGKQKLMLINLILGRAPDAPLGKPGSPPGKKAAGRALRPPEKASAKSRPSASRGPEKPRV